MARLARLMFSLSLVMIAINPISHRSMAMMATNPANAINTKNPRRAPLAMRCGAAYDA